MREEVVQAERVQSKDRKLSGNKLIRKYNLSTYFLVPIILDNGYKTQGFVNSYLYNTREDLNQFQHLYILMTIENPVFVTYKRYITHIETNEGFLYTFNIDSYKKDVELFIQGKYSEFSQGLKDLLCKKQQVKNIMLSDIYKILYKTDDRRKMIEELVGQPLLDHEELCSRCDVGDEIYE